MVRTEITRQALKKVNTAGQRKKRYTSLAVNDLYLKGIYSLTLSMVLPLRAVNDLHLKGSYSTQRSALFQKCAVNDLNLKGSYSEYHV